MRARSDCAVLAGAGGERTWRNAPLNADFFDGKALGQAILDRLGVAVATATSEELSAFLHPGKSARLTLDGTMLLEVGELHPRLQADLELKRPAVIVWGDFAALAPLVENRVQYRDIPQYPVVARDLALVADRTIPAAAIEDVIRRRAKSVLATVRLFDVYEGERIPQGKRSLAYQLRFCAPDRTLTDDEINQLVNKIVGDLRAKLGVELRS
jgi:phenylalanyl-tRNA synthetase beta chain